MSAVPRGTPGCTCGTPPFAPPEPSADCPYHGSGTPGDGPQDAQDGRAPDTPAGVSTVDAATIIGRAIKVLVDAGVCPAFNGTAAALDLTPAGGTDERRAILDALR
jgi:hypothetical protein